MYLLDANVVIYFKDSGHLQALVDAAARVKIGLAREVYDEVVVRNTRDGLAVKKLLDGSTIDIRTIPLAKSQALTSLRSGRQTGNRNNTADLGEDASIVLVAGDPDLLFVTNDRKGAFHALNELKETRGRVMTAHVFLYDLVSQSALSSTIAKQVGARMNLAPSWWASWS
jgi:hypothetical protein